VRPCADPAATADMRLALIAISSPRKDYANRDCRRTYEVGGSPGAKLQEITSKKLLKVAKARFVSHLDEVVNDRNRSARDPTPSASWWHSHNIGCCEQHGIAVGSDAAPDHATDVANLVALL
jgi:hypothetical protein